MRTIEVVAGGDVDAVLLDVVVECWQPAPKPGTASMHPAIAMESSHLVLQQYIIYKSGPIIRNKTCLLYFFRRVNTLK